MEDKTSGAEDGDRKNLQSQPSNFRFPTSSFLLIPAVLLLVAGCAWRYSCSLLFYRVHSGNFSAQNLTVNSPYPNKILWLAFEDVFPIFAKDYLLPVFALILPSVLLFSVGLSGIFKNRKFNLFSFLKDPQKEKIFLIVIFIAVLLWIIWSQFTILGNYPVTGDEFSYLFQSDLIASGKLYADSPVHADSFKSQQIINDGKWYSKVTIGWPLLLAMGRVLRVEFIVNPILSAFCVIIIYLLAKRLSGKKPAAAAAAILAAISPFFFLNGGTYFNHTSESFFVLLFTYLVILSLEKEKTTYIIGAGLCIVFAVLIRPTDGAAAFAGIIPLIAYRSFKSGNYKKKLASFTPVFILFLIGISLLLVVNKVQTGSFTTFGYQKYMPEEKLGFGTFGHTPVKGLWNFSYSMMRLSFWIAPLIFLMGVLSVFDDKSHARFLLVIPVAMAAVYFSYYSLGNIEIGSRYYLPGYPIIVATASVGISLVEDFLKKNDLPGAKTFITCFFLIIFLFLVSGVFPRLLPTVKTQYFSNVDAFKRIVDPPGIGQKSLIFMKRDAPVYRNVILTRNFWRYKQEKHLQVLYLDPEENSDLISMFPDRKVYTANYDPRLGKYVITPGIDNKKNAENFYWAGHNYDQGLKKERAKKSFRKAVELDSDYSPAWYQLAVLNFLAGEYKKAAEISQEMSRSGKDRSGFLYIAARSYGKMGEYEKAACIMELLGRTTSNRILAARSRNWANFFREEEKR